MIVEDKTDDVLSYNFQIIFNFFFSRYIFCMLPLSCTSPFSVCLPLHLGSLVKVGPLGSDEDGCIVGVLWGWPPEGG